MPAKPDLSEFEALVIQQGPRCTVATALNALGDEAAKVNAAFAADHITSTAITRWLRQRGIRVDNRAVQRHRRKECRCE